MSDPLYSLRQVSEFTGTTLKTVRRWVEEKRIPVERVGPLRLKRVRVKHSVLLALFPPKSSTDGNRGKDIAAAIVSDTAFFDDSGVYFLECAGFIKIGIAESIARRFGAIRTSCPLDVVPLGFISERYMSRMCEIERELHALFAGDRHRGEWFRDSPELRNIIATRAKPWARK